MFNKNKFFQLQQQKLKQLDVPVLQNVKKTSEISKEWQCRKSSPQEMLLCVTIEHLTHATFET